MKKYILQYLMALLLVFAMGINLNQFSCCDKHDEANNWVSTPTISTFGILEEKGTG